MNAFRFLSLLTVGFCLLMFVFLLNATQGRLEGEAVRVLRGPEVDLEPGRTATWKVRLGSDRVEEAWPAPQRQPRLFLEGDIQGASVTATARYEGESVNTLTAFISGGRAVGAPGEEEGELAFGPLWMSWEGALVIDVTVGQVEPPARGKKAQLVLRGKATKDYIAARSMARTLWFCFTFIAAAGFAGLMLTEFHGRERPAPE